MLTDSKTKVDTNKCIKILGIFSNITTPRLFRALSAIQKSYMKQNMIISAQQSPDRQPGRHTGLPLPNPSFDSRYACRGGPMCPPFYLRLPASLFCIAPVSMLRFLNPFNFQHDVFLFDPVDSLHTAICGGSIKKGDGFSRKIFVGQVFSARINRGH